MTLFKNIYLYLIVIFLLVTGSANAQSLLSGNWETNTGKSLIDLNELRRGGPPKDGIPSIDNPRFIPVDAAQSWLADKEPVIALEINGQARAYPLQILIWHEIVNDQIGDQAVLVTFCPLCYSAIVFKRTIDKETVEFGVSGFLRHSDMVMYDRKTESLWQQFTGEAIVGDLAGKKLQQIPSQIVSFEQFQKSYPDGTVLSKDTGYQRNYGMNPYTGYDDINNKPMFNTATDNRLPPMEKVIGIKLPAQSKTYPYSITKKRRSSTIRWMETTLLYFILRGPARRLMLPKYPIPARMARQGYLNEPSMDNR